PEAVWKAIYYHYLPIGVEADAPPSKAQLGKASLTWVAVSLADKLDTVVGLFAAGERPTGSRDPFALRRAAQGILKIATESSLMLGYDSQLRPIGALIEQAHRNYGASLTATEGWHAALFEFLKEREEHLLVKRGFEAGEARAVESHWRDPHLALQCVEAVARYRSSEDFKALAGVFKRVKNITRDADPLAEVTLEELKTRLKEPAEIALADEIIRRGPAIQQALFDSRFNDVMKEIVGFREPVERFFDDVLVMADDMPLREARLAFLVRLKKQILLFADPSAIATE
ncbi:MAG TPA: glycine--tRNA ligase subunit beta, partial [Vicinamibacterales bacterium]